LKVGEIVEGKVVEIESLILIATSDIEKLMDKAIKLEEPKVTRLSGTMRFPEDLIKKDMELMGFVMWDRLTINEKAKVIDVYGWIKREDSHEDFVLLEYKQTKKINVWDTAYSTSSLKYTPEIHDILECQGKHNNCIRIEDKFNIVNMIKNG